MSETTLKKLRKQQQIFDWKIITLNKYQLNQLLGECCCISRKGPRVVFIQIKTKKSPKTLL